MGTHPIFESDFDCLTEMYRNASFLQRTQLALRFRQLSITEELNRRGYTGSKTAFYSSLGNENYKKKRSSSNRFQVSPIPTVPRLIGGGDRFKPAMVDQFNDRPKTSLPMTKLPKQKFAWNQNITEDNLKILKELDENERNSESKSLFKDADWPIYKYKLGSRRTGLIMKKIGVEALWLKDGTKQICTMFQVQNCHVIKYFPRHEHNGKHACVIVGTGLGNPYLKNENYLDYCLDAGVSPKAKLARFPITENARIEPGRQLHLQHFHVGQKVDIVQRSVDYGFQDVVTRFHKKEVRRAPHHERMWKVRGRHVGGIAGRGNTRQGNPNWFNELSGRPLKGRRQPGQLGGCDTPAWSRKVLRMNTKFQIMWIKGRTPGHVGDYARVYDTRTSANMIGFAREPPMFPTYMPEYHGNEWTDEIFDVSVHPFDEPSIKF